MLTRISVSLPGELVTEVDALAHQRQVSRSRLVWESLEQLLQQERHRQTLARARELYAAIEAEDAALAETWLSLAAETVPPYQPENAEKAGAP